MGNERLYYTLDSYSVPTQLQLLAPMTPTTISKIAAQYTFILLSSPMETSQFTCSGKSHSS